MKGIQEMPITIKGETYIDTSEAIVILGVTRQAISEYVKEGKLQTYKQGIKRKIFYKQAEVDDLADMKPGNYREEE